MDGDELCPDCGFDFCEACYERAERLGRALDNLLCVECPDPGLCAAEAECCAGGRS